MTTPSQLTLTVSPSERKSSKLFLLLHMDDDPGTMTPRSNILKPLLLTLTAAFLLTLLVFLFHHRTSPESTSAKYLIPSTPPGEDFNKPPGGGTRPLPKIQGGIPARISEFPYQVSLQAFHYETQSFNATCGAVLISPSALLTAAHCAQFNFGPYDPSFRVLAGEVDISRETRSNSAQTAPVAKFLVHPQWDSFTKAHDIALLFLRHPLDLNEFVQPINLPPPFHRIPPGEVTVIGWGSERTGIQHKTLQKLETRVYGKSLCSREIGDDFKDEMLCAGSFDGKQDACPGDSGGPLVGKDLEMPYVAGIVSWGYVHCGIAGLVGFYTDVSHYVNWIHEEIQRHAAHSTKSHSNNN